MKESKSSKNPAPDQARVQEEKGRKEGLEEEELFIGIFSADTLSQRRKMSRKVFFFHGLDQKGSIGAGNKGFLDENRTFLGEV